MDGLGEAPVQTSGRPLPVFARLLAVPDALVRYPAEIAAQAPRVSPDALPDFRAIFRTAGLLLLPPTTARQTLPPLLSLVEGSKWRTRSSPAPPPAPSWVAARAQPSLQALPTASPYRSLGLLFRGRHWRWLFSPHPDPFSPYQGRVAS
ncbi:hypothetical protein NDU88_007995 [Pleurodeles waltl]|uniref:Uncharacterized protein n=1 Tax=Pleurodeles waltl TaxID=8319 RepID=A0AAV7QQE7_PLEWA|nr:hypothetical protein NDU88_007995 [Pleurodeles waltl]